MALLCGWEIEKINRCRSLEKKLSYILHICMLHVCIHVSLVGVHNYITCVSLYVTHMYPYVICVNLFVTRTYPYVICVYLYVTRIPMLLVCIRMLHICICMSLRGIHILVLFTQLR